MAAASGASPAPAPPPTDRDWMASTPAHAPTGFAEGDVVLAYHGSLLYEALIKKVLWKDSRLYSYVLNYQGWKKSWDAEVPHDSVFEHNDDNLRVAHRLLQGAKQRQQAIRPVDDRHFSPAEREYVSFVVPGTFPESSDVRAAAPASPGSVATPAPAVPRDPNTSNIMVAPVASPRSNSNRFSATHPDQPGSAPHPTDAESTTPAPQQAGAKRPTSIGPSPQEQHRSPSLDRSTPVRRPSSEQYPGMMRSSPMRPRHPPVKTESAPQVNGQANGLHGANGSDPQNRDSDVRMLDVKESPVIGSSATPARSSPTTEGEEARGVPRAARPGVSSDAAEPLFVLPAPLQQQLVDDWEFVTKEHRLVPLPRKDSVASIVEKWARSHDAPEDIACREVAEGIKAYFNSALPTTLLYKFERLQFNEFYFGPNSMARDDAYPVRHYGAEHLTRLLLKLPYMLESTGVDMDMMRRIAEKVNDLARFIAENGRLLFLFEYDAPSEHYIRKVQNGEIEPTPPDPDYSPADDTPRSIDGPQRDNALPEPSAMTPSPAHSTPAGRSTTPRHTPTRSSPAHASTPQSTHTPPAPSPTNRNTPSGSAAHGAQTPSPARSTPRS